MADKKGLRSIKYGTGKQTVPKNNMTIEDIKKAGLFGLDLISPAYDVQEYKQGVEQTFSGDPYGIPRAAAGLLGMVVPGSKYISQTAKKAAKKITPKKSYPEPTDKQKQDFLDYITDPNVGKYLDKQASNPKVYPALPIGKEFKVYHGTNKPFKGEGFRTGTGVLFTSPDPVFADSFMRSSLYADKGSYIKGSRTYPLRVKENANIFDPTNEKQFNKLLKNKRFKAWVKRNNKVYNDGAPDIGDVPLTEKQFLKSIKENKFFNDGAANFIEQEDLHPILKDLGYDGFTMRESGSTNVGLFLNDKGTSPVLKTLDQKKQGGSIENFLRSLT